MKYKSKNSHKKSTLQTYRFRKKFFIFSAPTRSRQTIKKPFISPLVSNGALIS